MLPLIEAKRLAHVLGTVIANNVLTIGAWGVVALAGGIVSQLVHSLIKANSPCVFRRLARKAT